MQASTRCIEKLKEYEQYRAYPYPDPYSDLGKATRKIRWGTRPAADVLASLAPNVANLSGKPWTQGYGETDGVTPNNPPVTEPQAYTRLVREVIKYGAGVLAACTIAPNQNQLDALTHCAYNIGIAGMRGSSMMRAHNRGDALAAARAFCLWNKAGGVESPGLTRRRAYEAAWYLRPVPEAARPAPAPIVADSPGEPETPEPTALPMPQEVDAERSMGESSINRASVVAGGTAAVATVAETARTIADVRYSVASLQDWLLPIALIVIVALCGYIVWERMRQRKDGWA